MSITGVRFGQAPSTAIPRASRQPVSPGRPTETAGGSKLVCTTAILGLLAVGAAALGGYAGYRGIRSGWTHAHTLEYGFFSGRAWKETFITGPWNAVKSAWQGVFGGKKPTVTDYGNKISLDLAELYKIHIAETAKNGIPRLGPLRDEIATGSHAVLGSLKPHIDAYAKNIHEVENIGKVSLDKVVGLAEAVGKSYSTLMENFFKLLPKA